MVRNTEYNTKQYNAMQCLIQHNFLLTFYF